MKEKQPKLMRKMLIELVLLFCGCSNSAEKYPNAKDLPVKNGVISHPVYGDYPETVPFEQGMTLHPGQSAVGNIVIKIEE